MKKEVQRINIVLRHASNIKEFLYDIAEEEWNKSKEKQQASMYSLMAISENVKELLKTDNSLIERYENIPWGDIARFRDKMSHHYDTINAAMIFEICKKKYTSLGQGHRNGKKAFFKPRYGQIIQVTQKASRNLFDHM